MNIKDIFLEVLEEAKNGNITIDDLDYNISFNTSINNNSEYYNESNDILINIDNLDTFMNVLEEYIHTEESIGRKSIKYVNSKRDYYKTLILYLFINATTGDYYNFTSYVRRYINYLNDQSLNTFNEGINFHNGKTFEGELLHIKNKQQSALMETPNKLEISFMNEEDNSLEFKLPEISYGICEENGKKVCYIYSILNKENLDKVSDEKLLKYKKKISRILYKLNKGISKIETEEFKNNNTDYYAENITDISVSSVLSLYIFINIIKEKADMIKGVPYLPLRYISRDNALDNITDDNRRKELEDRNENIQMNLTDKFIRTFRRVNIYLPFMSVDSYPYEYDEFITCSLSRINEEIIDNEVTSSINIKGL